MEVDIDTDLNAVNDQLTQMVEELNKCNAQREQLIQQVQNLNGIAMNLRGKLPPEEKEDGAESVIATEGEIVESRDSLDRSSEYPVNTT